MVHLVVVLLGLTLELFGHQVDRGVHVGRRLPGAHHRAAREHGRFGDLRVGAGVAFLDDELELDPSDLVDVSFAQHTVKLGELLLGVVPQRFADDHVATLDLDLHEGGSFTPDDPKRSENENRGRRAQT